jgi:hypothetical protein
MIVWAPVSRISFLSGAMSLAVLPIRSGLNSAISPSDRMPDVPIRALLPSKTQRPVPYLVVLLLWF